MTTTNSTTFINGSLIAPVAVTDTCSSGAFENVFSVTQRQRQIWQSCLPSVEASCAFNEITTVKLIGKLNIDALCNALQQVVHRHECLRSTFSGCGNQMVVHENNKVACKYFDWSGQDEDDLAISQLRLIQAESCIPFNLVKGPLFRSAIQKVSEYEHHLTVTAHKIVLDEQSRMVLIRDIGYFYDVEMGRSTKSVPDPPSYQKYLKGLDKYLKSEDSIRDEEFWFTQFNDEVLELELPNDRKRPSLRTYFSRRYDHLMSSTSNECIERLCKQNDCSVFETLLAAFELFVARLSTICEFYFSIPDTSQKYLDRQGLVGQCSNLVWHRVLVEEQESCACHIEKCRHRLQNALDHQRFCFDKCRTIDSNSLRTNRRSNPAISFDVVPRIEDGQLGFDGIDVSVQIEPKMFENFEWSVRLAFNADDSVELQIQYNSDLFSSARMKSLSADFERFLIELATDPNAKIANILHSKPNVDTTQKSSALR